MLQVFTISAGHLGWGRVGVWRHLGDYQFLISVNCNASKGVARCYECLLCLPGVKDVGH